MEQKSKLYRFLEQKIKKLNLKPKTNKFALSALYFLYNGFSILVTVLIIRTYVASPFQVYGASMCNNINFINNECVQGYGDYMFIDKFTYLYSSPKRGDVIVLKTPFNHNEYFIKRIIGLPGDTVRLKEGYVYISNAKNPTEVKLTETYLNDENQGNTYALFRDRSEFTVPEGKYLVLGDNRQHSSDSRTCFKDATVAKGCEDPTMTNYLDRNLIEGKASLILWPRLKWVDHFQYPELKN